MQVKFLPTSETFDSLDYVLSNNIASGAELVEKRIADSQIR